MKTTNLQDTLKFSKDFKQRYNYTMFSEIGFYKSREGWTILLDSMVGNTTTNNAFFDYYPIFESDVQASEAVNIFCLINSQFKNRNHMEYYDNLPLR